MKKIGLLLLFASGLVFSQNYLEEGNNLMSQNRFADAESVFRKGVKQEPLKSQLALTLTSQNKNDQAEKVITGILKKDPSFSAALWYGGINNFSKDQPDFRKAIGYFERLYAIIDKNSDQYFALNFYIGNSYRNVLNIEGLSYDEVNRMLETYKVYIEMQPDAEDIQEAKEFVQKIEENRPGKNVRKWRMVTG